VAFARGQSFMQRKAGARCTHELLDRGPSLGRRGAMARNELGFCLPISLCRALRSGTDRGPTSHRQLVDVLAGAVEAEEQGGALG